MDQEEAKAAAERIVEWLVSEDGGGFNDSLLMPKVIEGISKILVLETRGFKHKE